MNEQEAKRVVGDLEMISTGDVNDNRFGAVNIKARIDPRYTTGWLSDRYDKTGRERPWEVVVDLYLKHSTWEDKTYRDEGITASIRVPFELMDYAVRNGLSLDLSFEGPTTKRRVRARLTADSGAEGKRKTVDKTYTEREH